mgnify:CR=1 FL=1
MATTYLTRTPSSSSNRKTWTWSAWIKLGALGTDRNLFGAYAHSSDNFKINIADTDTVSMRFYNGTEYQLGLNRKFRDTSAWYHLVFAVDTTLASGGDRFKIYVNGIRETSFAAANDPTLDLQMTINDTTATQIGRFNTGSYFDGYMNNVAFVDGTALTPTSFGETDSASGIWKFKTPSGVTWGTNGFHLKMDNSANLGLDSSGETNNFTLSGNGRQAKDTPTNVYATLNPLDNFYSASTFANGNTSQTSNASNYGWVVSTLGITSGKFYAECKQTGFSGGSNYNLIGVASYQNTTTAQFLGESAGNASYYAQGEIYNGNGTDIGSMPTYTTNDIIGVAVDLDNNFIYWHKNGVYINSGVPTSGGTGTGGLALTASSSTSLGAYFFGSGDYGNTVIVNNSWNFGNGYFGTTAITSAGSNGNGSLFEYDVPSGYYALNTKNINTYG